MANKRDDDLGEVEGIEDVQNIDRQDDPKTSMGQMINQAHKELYLEAIRKYPVDDAIDLDAEKRLKRKLDMRILPLLGICYFFYVSELHHSLSIVTFRVC